MGRIIFAFSSSIFADIKFKQDLNSWIEVELFNSGNEVMFSYCEIELNCELIGEGSYSVDDLTKLRNSNYFKSGKLIAGGAVIVVGGVVVGAAAGAGVGVVVALKATASSSMTAIGLGFLVGASSGGLAGGVGSNLYSVKKLNPLAGLRNGRKIRKKVLKDEPINIRRGLADDYAAELEVLLLKIDAVK